MAVDVMDNASDKLHFGICGLGFMGRTHLRSLRDNPHAHVAAVCDRDPRLRAGHWTDATGNIAQQEAEPVDLAGVAAYASPEKLIRDPAVDAVVVALPTAQHVEVTEQALAAGKHVLCEKPMAGDLAGCDRMIRAAENAGRTLMIAQCIRFWPQYEMIKGFVDEGRIGPVRFVKLKRVCSPPLYSSDNWLIDGSQSGGALLDLHVHDVDFAHHLLGVPDTLSAGGRHGPSGQIDHVFATYAYPDGRLALLEGGWLYHRPWAFEMAITVCGEKGTLEWSSQRGTDVLLYADGEEAERSDCDDETGWKREVDYFVECLAAGRPVQRCPPASSRTSIGLVLLERQAIESGEVVRVARVSAWGS